MSKIIVITNKSKELYMSLYEFIDWYWKKLDRFVMVCHVTKEEYETMQDQMKHVGCLEELLSRTSTSNHSYDKFRYVMLYDKYTKNLAILDYENPKKEGGYILRRDGIIYDKNASQDVNNPKNLWKFGVRDVKVYTTETYEQIVAHYLSEEL